MKVLDRIQADKKLPQAAKTAAMMMVESILFNVAKSQVEGYTGGKWDDVAISRGYFVAKVPGTGKVHVVGTMNHSDVTTTPEAAGAAMTLLAVNWAGNWFYEKGYQPIAQHLFDYYHKLKDAILRTKTLDIPAILEIID